MCVCVCVCVCVCDLQPKDLITRMLHVDTTRRLRVGEVLDHQWLKVCVEGGWVGEMTSMCAPSVSHLF